MTQGMPRICIKKQYTVILYRYFRKARVKPNFAGTLEQIANVRISESIKDPLCARVRRPQNQADIDEPKRIQYAEECEIALS